MSTTITPAHQSKPAYIYVRQLTLAQVRHNQESTERQYALRDKALALGWSPRSIQVLDRDQGLSGAQSAGREDFKTLVADVSMGQVGAVFALEVSRLARSNLDWHRLLELCALTHTLVIDADGCYDPADFNDGLLLGLKGTMAQAELHFLRGRLLGGKLNKARKGELRTPLPVGLAYDDEARIVMDPDDEVRGAVQLVFRLFQEEGSAYAVVQRFAQGGLRFPTRAYGGAWAGKLIWGRLAHSRVLSLIKNPAYAGTYVFGRYQYAKTITPDGEVRKSMRAMPKSEWRVQLPDHHEGYITAEEFERNQQQLAHNRTNAEGTVLSGPAREGLALLQGLALCANCGRCLTVRYRGNGGMAGTAVHRLREGQIAGWRGRVALLRTHASGWTAGVDAVAAGVFAGRGVMDDGTAKELPDRHGRRPGPGGTITGADGSWQGYGARGQVPGAHQQLGFTPVTLCTGCNGIGRSRGEHLDLGDGHGPVPAGPAPEGYRLRGGGDRAHLGDPRRGLHHHRPPAGLRGVGRTANYSFEAFTRAVRLVEAGARFIATNPDPTGPGDGGTVPACGAVAALIEKASGVNAFFVGKPNPLMMRMALKHIGAHSENTVMVGDRMDTDVIAGVQSGLETILVLSGVTRREDVDRFPYRPGRILESVADIEP